MTAQGTAVETGRPFRSSEEKKSTERQEEKMGFHAPRLSASASAGLLVLRLAAGLAFVFHGES